MKKQKKKNMKLRKFWIKKLKKKLYFTMLNGKDTMMMKING